MQQLPLPTVQRYHLIKGQLYQIVLPSGALTAVFSINP